MADDPGLADDGELVFTTKPKPAAGPDEHVLEFRLDGVLLGASRPSPEVLASVLRAGARGTRAADQVHALMTFVERALTPQSREHVLNRFEDDEDPFALEDLIDLSVQLAKKLTPPLNRAARARHTV